MSALVKCNHTFKSLHECLAAKPNDKEGKKRLFLKYSTLHAIVKIAPLSNSYSSSSTRHCDPSFQGESLLNKYIRLRVALLLDGVTAHEHLHSIREYLNAVLQCFDWAPRPCFTVVCHHLHPTPPNIPSITKKLQLHTTL